MYSLRQSSSFRLASSSDKNQRVFAHAAGVSVARFVLSSRLERAQALLETTSLPLERVAERSGLGSIDSLQRLFRARVGVTLSDYRTRFQHRMRSARA